MYHIHVDSRKMTELMTVSFSSSGLKERQDLQEWIVSNPSCLGEELLIIQKEFSGFDKTNERLDLLALDTKGNLVIIENKTDSSGRDVVWQSVKYASYCSRLTEEKVFDVYAQYLEKYSHQESTTADFMKLAEDSILEFLDNDTDEPIKINSGDVSQRIILVAVNFNPEVTSAVLWLMNFGIDIKCMKCQLFKFNEELLFDMRQILPVVEAQEFMIDLAEKKQAEVKTNTDRKYRLKSFWSQFVVSETVGFENIYSHRSPTTDNWLGLNIGVSGVGVCVVIAKNYVTVRLEINESTKEETLRVFDHLFEYQNEIQSHFDKSIDWLRKPDNVYSQISITNKELGYESESNWQASIDYLIENSFKLRELVKRIMADLK